jgi:hypothetical protein
MRRDIFYEETICRKESNESKIWKYVDKIKEGGGISDDYGIAALYHNGIYSWTGLSIYIQCGPDIH